MGLKCRASVLWSARVERPLVAALRRGLGCWVVSCFLAAPCLARSAIGQAIALVVRSGGTCLAPPENLLTRFGPRDRLPIAALSTCPAISYWSCRPCWMYASVVVDVTARGPTRRSFLKVGALGAGGLTLSHLLQSRSLANGAPAQDQTAVVWLWLNGGPTHIETFDPKMTAPAEFRSLTGEVKTVLPGVSLGGNFEKLAQVADRMAFVRSFAHGNNSHNNAAFWVMTGHPHTEERPSLGSIAARVRGANHPRTGMPTYVKSGQVGFNDKVSVIAGPAWLGKAYAPFQPDGEARKNMQLATAVSRLDDRRTLLRGLDRLRRESDASGVIEGMDGFDQQALNLILGHAPQAFDITREDPKLVAAYGDGLGASMLMARRLCEAGCGFVTIGYQGWDMHGNVKRNMDRRGPEVDRAVAAFVEDIYQRGLDQKIMLVVTGEFGRTPRINQRAGRDHWSSLCTLAISGGGLQMGQTVGESSAKAETPHSNRISPQQLMATVFHVLGIAAETQFYDPNGRPISMLADRTPIRELV